MFMVRVTAALSLLAVLCCANDRQLRFFFPSSGLLLGVGDASVGSAQGHRVSSFGDQHREGFRGRDRSENSQNNEEEQLVSSNNGVREPSKCVWAILGCCVAGSQRVNLQCFEEKGCQGNFWDQSPCRRESAAAAHRVAMRYYEMKEKEKREEMPEALLENRPNTTPHSPFDPIGPLPSREESAS